MCDLQSFEVKDLLKSNDGTLAVEVVGMGRSFMRVGTVVSSSFDAATSSNPRFLSTSFPFDPRVNHFTRLCSEGSLKEAFDNLTSEIWSNPSLFSHLLQGCIPLKSLPLGKQLHALTITSGCCADKFVNNHLLNMYTKMGALGVALKLYDVMPKKNSMSCNILIGGYILHDDLEGALKVFNEMPDRNVATWNAMVTGMIQFEFNEEGLSLFSQMHRVGFSPDEFALGSALKGCAGLKALAPGRQVHGYAVKSGFAFYTVVGSALTHMYMRCKSLKDGKRVVGEMPTRTVVAFNTLIAGLAQNGCFEGALDQYKLMKALGFRPDIITFVSVISSCSEMATLGQGQQVHANAIKVGADSVVSVASSLISMYSRCGCLDDSVLVFIEREGSDVVLWSAMIAAYGFHGQGKKAIEVFHQMKKEGFEATNVTFLSMLYACSHSQLTDEGVRFFNIMVDYNLKPTLEHYTCMVDLLGRSGRLQEAEDMIRTMPVEADAVIWKTLLSACKIHKKEAGMAQIVAQEILKIDPLDASGYVLLANIHASEKSWEDVSNVRKAMRDRNVKKEPGISWFEFKNKIQQFVVGDKSHPEWKEINLYLKELMWELKVQGYVPDTGSVLHDMEIEEKEYNLVHHSEKVAIAYALMITPPGSPIRVMKNLRVCGDCHVAIKLISKVKNRDIIVRDASRFHHFKHGQCSCADYW